MKSIQRRFSSIAAQRPHHSTYIWFAAAIRGQRFSRRRIALNFNKLVDKDDYVRSEKKEIIDYLYELSETPDKEAEAGTIRHQIPP